MSSGFTIFIFQLETCLPITHTKSHIYLLSYLIQRLNYRYPLCRFSLLLALKYLLFSSKGN